MSEKPRPASRAALLLGQWSKGVAEMTQALDGDDFPAVLLQAVRRLVDVDFVMTFAYRSGSHPIALGDTLQAKPRQIIIQRYLDGPYMLDPFFQAVNAGTTRGCFRVHDLAPDRFRQSEYFRAHYRLTGIGEEIGFFFALPEDVVAVMSLARWVGSPKLTRPDLELLAAIEPAIGSLCALAWADAGRRMGRPPKGITGGRERGAQSAQISRAYEQFGNRLLSDRERQVAALVLQGHSSESIARHLDISPGTVKIHRRNCYRKLGISTQAELFAAFLGALG